MDILTRPFDPAASPQGPLLPFPPGAVLPFAVVGAAALAAGGLGRRTLMRTLGAVSVHGGLLAAALAAAWDGGAGYRRPAGLLAGALALGAAACGLTPGGCLGYLLPVAALARIAVRHPESARLGLAPAGGRRALLLGAAAGGFLGAHLLLSASRTWGAVIALDSPARFVADLCYDVGANVLSAECFFRGTLFNRWQRRWGFWTASGAATALSVLRYLLDPALPRAAGILVGALFYTGLLGLSGCALLWYSGSLLPSLLGAAVFFVCYRLLRLQ